MINKTKKGNTIIAFIVLFIFWFLFQIIMETCHHRVYPINTIGHVIVAYSFSIMSIWLYYLFKISDREEQNRQKTQKYFLRIGFWMFLFALFLLTIIDIYFGSKGRYSYIYHKPISWDKYFDRLPTLLCFSSIIGILTYLFLYNLEKKKKKEKNNNKFSKK